MQATKYIALIQTKLTLALVREFVIWSVAQILVRALLIYP